MMEHPRTVRVAAVQAASVAYDLHKSMHKLRSLVFTAKDNGAEIVVFPEAFLSAGAGVRRTVTGMGGMSR